MNKLTTTLLSACFAFAAGTSFAQDTMSKDGMAKDGMKKDEMTKDPLGKFKIHFNCICHVIILNVVCTAKTRC